MQETSSHRPLDSVEGGQGPEMEQQKLRLRRPDCVLLPTDLMLGCAFVNSKLGSGALGMWGVGNDEDEQACLTVEAAFTCGIRDYDTAPYYGPSERRVGMALRRLGAEAVSQLRLFTKVGVVRETSGESGTVAELGASASGARISCAESMTRLGVSKLAGLRFHDIPDGSGSGRVSTTDALIQASLEPDGMIAGLRAMREEGLIGHVSLGMNCGGGARKDWADTTQPVYGTPDQVLDLIRGAPEKTFDSVLIANGWNLLCHTGLPVLLECERRGIAVHNAGTFATGLLAGGDSFAYGKPSDDVAKRARQWRALSEDKYGLRLPAVALAFSAMPACVAKVVVGCSAAAEVQQCVELLRSASAVPPQLWDDARAMGLLSPHLNLPALAP